MSTLPKLSIVTPSFNSIHTIRATIASVAQQDYAHVEQGEALLFSARLKRPMWQPA